MKVYIAGKVSQKSHFGRSDWRQSFIEELTRLSGLDIINLDPLKYEADKPYDPQYIFDLDCWLISKADCVIVYLTDDISVGGSQEMLIAKYLNKPLIGLAPREGKFNKSHKKTPNRVIDNYIDPFVFATCDVIAETIEEVSQAIKNLPKSKIMGGWKLSKMVSGV